MRIIYIAPFDVSLNTGYAEHVRNTLRELARCSVSVELFSATAPERDLSHGIRATQVPQITVSGLYALSFGLMLLPLMFVRLLLRRPDVVVSRYFAGLPLTLPLLRLMGVRTAVEVNADIAVEYGLSSIRDIRAWIRCLTERVIYSMSSIILVVSQGIAESIRDRFPEYVEKVHLLENGVDVERYGVRDRKECRSNLGLPSDGAYVVFVGEFQHWQGLTPLMDALSIVFAQMPICEALLVGDGPMRAAVEKQVKDGGLEGRVRFMGYQGTEVVARCIGAADVCVAPYGSCARGSSAKLEYGVPMRGSPLKVLTYMACARPVVATYFREAGVLLEKIGAGIATPPDDPPAIALAILKIISDRQRAEAMGKAGRAYVEQERTWGMVTKRMLHIIGGQNS